MLARALLAVLVLPGFFAGILPWLIALRDPWRREGFDLGALVLGAGIGIIAVCVRDFFTVGRGTLAPWDPPRHLVVVGLYKYVRNPMYVGVLLTVLGVALVAGSPLVLLYDAILFIGFHLRVLMHEEPWLARTFGDEWVRYKSEVRRWLPGTRPRA